MVQCDRIRYDVRILTALLDAYEKSVLSRGENKVAVHITFSFTRKTMPEYFDESSMAYEEIHAAVKELERKGLLKIVWKNGKEDFIIQKVVLCEKCAEAAYSYVGRTPKLETERRVLRLLEELKEQYGAEADAADKSADVSLNTTTAGRFIDYLAGRIREGKSVKEYAELTDTKRLSDMVRVVSAIEKNEEELYIREFSIRCFGDSKRFEELLGVTGKVLQRFGGYSAYEMDVYAILAEHGIYHTPNYVQLKGDVRLYVQIEDMNCGAAGMHCKEADIGKADSEICRTSGTWLELSALKQGIGISGEDLKCVQVKCWPNVKRVITIENLTTFYRWSEPDSVIIYLGGYHNSVRRKLLRMLYEQMPGAEYLHFGDIDVGGFEIYEDLCRRTGIPFHPYRMGVEELQAYEAYTKPLTENDKKRLAVMLERVKEQECVQGSDFRQEYRRVLEYMKEHEVKLEQECILYRTEVRPLR